MTKHAFAWRQQAGKLRRNAQLVGMPKYVNPWPCPQGHTVRYTSNGKCVQCHISGVRRSNETQI
jgi:hypothetical protein